MLFQYKGRDAHGRPVSGRLEAEDREAALTQLHQGGLFIVELTSPRLRWGLNTELSFSLRPRGAVSTADLAAFCGQFAALIGAGITILQGLRVLSSQFSGRKLEQILLEMVEGIESGKSLSEAMREHRRHLPGSLIYITSVAELSGQLEHGYTLLAQQYEQDDQFTRKIRTAMAYPAVVLAVAFLVILFMLTFVLPKYTEMFAQMGAALPGPTLALLGVASFLQRFWWLVLLLGGGLAALLPRLLRRRAILERWQRMLLRAPVVGSLIYQRELVRFCRMLNTMISSGVPLLAALRAVEDAVELLPLGRALSLVQEQVREGDSFGSALAAQPFFSRIVVEMVALGETAGNLDQMLERVAAMSEKQASGMIERATSLVEPALTLFLGGIVLAIIVPMLLPMFDIVGQIQ